MTTIYTIIAKEQGERIDALLAVEIEGLSRSQAVKLIEQGAVTLGSASVKKNHKVTEGEVFTVRISQAEDEAILPENIPLDIIYEDEELIVINKPRGMVVHPAPGHTRGTLVNALLYHCGENLSAIGGDERPGIVHRIDKDTSGLIIVAKNDDAHTKLSAQLADRSLSRVYEAIVHGNFKEDMGSVNKPIGRSPSDRKKMAVTEKNSRPAVTHYEVISRYRGFCHVRCSLETGRTHQIRVHMAYIGHPVLGDLTYGAKGGGKGLYGQCLHSKSLKFIHPKTQIPMELSSELPEYFTDVIKRLGNSE